MYMGSSPTQASTVNSLETMVGRSFQYHRSFVTGSVPSSFSGSPAGSDPGQGWRSGFSFGAADNTALSAIASGSKDTAIRNFIESIPSGHKVDFTFCHEANAKLDTSTLANQIAAFNRIADLWDDMAADSVTQVTSGDVLLALCLTNYNWNNQNSTTWNRYNSIIERVGILTIDIYGGLLGPSRQWPANSADFMAWWDATGSGLGTGRVGLWETSCNDGGTSDGITKKLQWIQQSVEGMYNIGAEAFSGYHGTVGGSQPIFNRQEYADLYATLIDTYGEAGSAPPPSGDGGGGEPSVVTGGATGPATSTGTGTSGGIWIEPVRISSAHPYTGGPVDGNDDDAWFFNEAYIAYLEGNTFVVGALSSAWGTVHLWAINARTNTPVIGEYVIGADGASYNDGVLNPIDTEINPAYTNFNALIPLGGSRFAVLAEPWTEYPMGNSTVTWPVTMVFDVASDMSITRVSIPVADDDEYFTNRGSTGASWNGKLVTVQNNSFTYPDLNRIVIAAQDGTVTWHELDPTYEGNGPIAVSGDYAFVKTYRQSDSAGVIAKVDLTSGTVVDETAFEYDAWLTWMHTLANGHIAIISTTTTGSLPYASEPNVVLMILDPETLSITGPFTITDSASWAYYPMGDWLNQLRSVSSWQDGTILVGYMEQGDTFTLALVNQDGTIRQTMPVSTFQKEQAPVHTGNVREAGICQIGQGRAAAAFMTQVPGSTAEEYDNFGVYISYMLGASIGGGPVSDRRRFTAGRGG